MFAKAAKDCRKVVIASEVPVVFEYNEPGKKPVFSKDLIRFNGLDDDGHETFYVPQTFKAESWDKPDENNRWFGFCKTAEKPYDLCVTACLVILKHYLGDAIMIGSDGEQEDWQAGMSLVQKTLKYGEDFKLRDEC